MTSREGEFRIGDLGIGRIIGRRVHWHFRVRARTVVRGMRRVRDERLFTRTRLIRMRLR